MDVLQSLQPFAVISYIFPKLQLWQKIFTEREGDILLPVNAR